MRLKLHLAIGCLIVALAAGLWPAEAEAQRYYRGYRGRAYVSSGYYYPRFYYPGFYYPRYFYPGFYPGFYASFYPGFYYPGFSFGIGFGFGYPGYPWGFYGPYAYGPYWFDDSSDVRVQVTPRDAEVYVDGRFAGRVDSFDGMFQRLHVEPGGHEITIYHERYQPIVEKLYLSPRAGYKIQRAMEPLGAGEPAPPRPVPSAESPDPAQSPSRYPRDAYGRGGAAPPADRFGTLSIRIQPADAEVLIDGEPWRFPEGSDRFELQLGEGSHRLEVRKQGHEPYVTEVRVRTGEMVTLNISLPRKEPN